MRKVRKGMEIKKITLRHVRMPLLRPFTTSFGTMLNKEFVLVEVTDRNGISGWGESVAFVEPFYNEETLRGNWHMLQDLLIPLLQKSKIQQPSDLSERFQ